VPSVTRIEPNSGRAGDDYPIRATIYGSGFMAVGNVVDFGPVKISDLPSSGAGTEIIFSVPKVRPSGSEVPPMVLEEGDYSVVVTTEHGTSTPVVFSLTRSMSGRPK